MKVLDYTGTGHLVSKTKTELAKKVDKVTGKGLSTNDYTNAEKQKVADSLTDAPSDGKQYARQNGGWEELDLDGKANIDGYYDTLSVGLADNLIDRKGNGTPQEISYRTSCGDDSIADDGNGIIQSIFGKTVVWNQRIPRTASSSTSGGITYTNNNDGSWTINGTLNNSFSFKNLDFEDGVIKHYTGHKYYCTGVGDRVKIQIMYGNDIAVTIGGEEIKTLTPTTTGTRSWTRLVTYDTGQFVDYKITPQLIDLTQLFGSGNEPTTVDDPRIEWIKQYANEHPEYNSGELVSYNGSGIKTVGFNQWDEVWEVGGIDLNTGANYPQNDRIRSKNYINAFPSTTYYYKSGYGITTGNVYYYDANKEYISVQSGKGNNTFITPENCYYIRFVAGTAYGTTYNNDICINIAWSGYRNGEYEPYWSRTLALPISTYFPDGMKSAGSVRDELTKDKAVKRIGMVDLGTLGWAKASYGFYSWDMQTQLVSANAICSKYQIGGDTATPNIIFPRYGDGALIVTDTSYADAASFKAAMNGVMFYYELETPTETTITPPLDLTYKVADFGTEESIAEGKSTPFNGIIKYSDDFTRGLVNMPKNYDTTASLDALATSLSTMLTSALDGTVTITRGAYDSTNKKYAWNCSFTPNA